MEERMTVDCTYGLNPQQAEAVINTEGPMLIMAGAGSGKTKVLTCRVANLLQKGVRPYRILAITFTNKAAAEMRERVNNMSGSAAKDVWLFTFHAFCARFLRMEIDKLPGYGGNFAIYDTADSQNLIKQILKEMNLDDKRFQPSGILSCISNAKNALQDAAAFARQAGDFYEQKVADIYSRYEQKLQLNNALDFDDLLMLSIKLLQENKEVREKYQDRFDYLLVDEYQDTNHAQYLLTKFLAAKHRNICVVGDADQSIYGWRGADIQNILDFEKDYPDAKVIKLEQNYRSTQHILDAANAVIKNNEGRKGKTLWTKNGEGDKLGWRLDYNMKHRGDVYATHGLGPVAQVLDIHRGDRMKTLTAMDTKSVVGKGLVEAKTGSECTNFRNGDHTTTMIRTENGKVIEIQHNVMTPQPYNRLYQLTGVKGFANKYPTEGYALGADQLSASGVQPKVDNLSSHGFLPQAEMDALVEKYQHPILKKYGEIAKEVGGHGGMDFIMDSRLVYCLQNGLPLDMDVYDLAEWCALAELGEISMDNNCAAVEFPDFTRGEWNVVKGYKHAYASPEEEQASMEKAKAFTAKLKEQGAKEWTTEADK